MKIVRVEIRVPELLLGCSRRCSEATSTNYSTAMKRFCTLNFPAGHAVTPSCYLPLGVTATDMNSLIAQTVTYLVCRVTSCLINHSPTSFFFFWGWAGLLFSWHFYFGASLTLPAADDGLWTMVVVVRATVSTDHWSHWSRLRSDRPAAPPCCYTHPCHPTINSTNKDKLPSLSDLCASRCFWRLHRGWRSLPFHPLTSLPAASCWLTALRSRYFIHGILLSLSHTHFHFLFLGNERHTQTLPYQLKFTFRG